MDGVRPQVANKSSQQIRNITKFCQVVTHSYLFEAKKKAYSFYMIAYRKALAEMCTQLFLLFNLCEVKWLWCYVNQELL